MKSSMAPSGYKRAELDKPLEIEEGEIWLVPVPADFNVSRAKVLSAHEIEYEGKKYTLGPSGLPLGPTQLLTPRGKDSELKPAKNHRIEGLMSLTQNANLPEPDYSSECKPRQPVPQRTGLRIRHWASGYGPGSETVDENVSTHVKGSAAEDASPKHSSRKRSKHEDSQKAKKKKKERK